MPGKFLTDNKPERIFLFRIEAVFRTGGRTAASGANAHLESRYRHIGTGSDLVAAVLHGKQRRIRIGLDTKLKGLVHSSEGEFRLPIADLGPCTVAAVAAFLGFDI